MSGAPLGNGHFTVFLQVSWTISHRWS